MFAGMVPLGTALPLTFFTTDASGTPATPSVGPAYRVYGPTGLMQNGTGTPTNFDSVTGLYRASITPSVADGYEKGRTYFISVTYTCTVAKGEVFSFTVT